MEEEIDLREYWEILRKRWLIVVAIPIIAALVSGIISYYFIKPVYQASTTLIVGKKAEEAGQQATQMIDNFSVLQANQLLAKTYAAIAQSRTVEDSVIKDLNLPLKAEDLDKLITIDQVKDTEVLEIQVSNTNPQLAASIANTMAKEFSKAVIEIKKVDSVSIVDPAVPPDRPVKPNKTLNVLIAFVVGLMASVGLVFLLEYLDNTIKTTSDVEEVLGIPVLGVIPNYDISKQG